MDVEVTQERFGELGGEVGFGLRAAGDLGWLVREQEPGRVERQPGVRGRAVQWQACREELVQRPGGEGVRGGAREVEAVSQLGGWLPDDRFFDCLCGKEFGGDGVQLGDQPGGEQRGEIGDGVAPLGGGGREVGGRLACGPAADGLEQHAAHDPQQRWIVAQFGAVEQQTPALLGQQVGVVEVAAPVVVDRAAVLVEVGGQAGHPRAQAVPGRLLGEVPQDPADVAARGLGPQAVQGLGNRQGGAAGQGQAGEHGAGEPVPAPVRRDAQRPPGPEHGRDRGTAIAPRAGLLGAEQVAAGPVRCEGPRGGLLRR